MVHEMLVNSEHPERTSPELEDAFVFHVLDLCQSELNKNASPGASNQESRWIFEKVVGRGVVSFRQVQWKQISEVIRGEFWRLLRRRLKGEPLQYVLNAQPFLNLELAVGKGVFIPRPETEDLLLKAAQIRPSWGRLKCLDLCAGSGAMGIGLCHLYTVKDIQFVEKSPQAVSYLVRNTESFIDSSQTLARIYLGDMAVFLREETGTFDFVCCNPPYVAVEEKETLSREVLQEPADALFAGDHGKEFYARLKVAFEQKVSLGGVLLFEHHRDHQADLVPWIEKDWVGVKKVWPLRDRFDAPRGILVEKNEQIP